MSKSVSERKRLINKLDRIFSKYIRYRDIKGGCVSCGASITMNTSDCGHFYSRRYYSTRWHEDNCHAQCIKCNRFEEGNKYHYGKRLEIKIGKKRLENLEVIKNTSKKFTDIELKQMIEYYTKEVKKYEN